mgnify:FL=1
MIESERRNIITLWLAQVVSQSGDAIYQLALLWLILDITDSTIITGIAAMSAYFPALIFGLIAGVFSDRKNKLHLMILSNAAQAFTVILIPIVIYLKIENVWLICFLAFLKSSFNTLFQPAIQSLIPRLFLSKKLVKINSILISSGQIAWMLGPMTAGILLSYISINHLFFVDALTFLFAILFLLFINQNNPENENENENSSNWSELKIGITYLLNNKSLSYIMIITFINNLFIMGPAVVGLPILVRAALNGTASQFAYIEGCMAIGALFGSYLVTKLNQILKNGTIWALGLFIDGITFSFLLWADSIEKTMLLIFIHGIGIPFIIVSRTSIVQLHTPNNIHGRIFSFVHLGVVGTTALSSAIIGAITSIVSVKIVFFYFGLSASICGIISMGFSKIRNIE